MKLVNLWEVGKKALWQKIVDFSNLLCAAKKARKGKRYREDVLQFNQNLESNLFAIQEELLKQTYQPGPYKTFVVFEPKRRLISAAPYRDRVVQHALCNVIEPIFNASFSSSCYANRFGYGTHKALKHFIKLSKRFRYCLRMDVRQYFPSIDHEILKEKFREKIICPQTLWLADLILDAGNPQEDSTAWFPGDNLFTPFERRHGLPIGNLTSQLWANVYLDSIDHEIENLFGVWRYLRYVDDFALFSDDREELVKILDSTRNELSKIRLRLHDGKTDLIQTRKGVNFLGFRISPKKIRVRAENLKRARRRLRKYQWLFSRNEMSMDELTQSVRSWVAHLKQGDTWKLREMIFSSLSFQRREKGKGTSGQSGRELEQQ